MVGQAVSKRSGRALFFVSALLLGAVVGRDFTLGCRARQPDAIFATGYLNGSRPAVTAACLLAPVVFVTALWLLWWRRGRRAGVRMLAAAAVWSLALPYLFVVSTNIWLDRSPAELHASAIESVTEEYHSGGRGHAGGTTAYVVFESWRGAGPDSLEVTSAPARGTAAVELWVHSGFWGIPWVERCVYRSTGGSNCRFTGARFLPLWPR